MTPLIGQYLRCFLRSLRKADHSWASGALSSWKVKRPAVSRITASLENHQSQLRVPPAPESASAPTGNSRPEFCSVVLLPDCGSPISRYHGSP